MYENNDKYINNKYYIYMYFNCMYRKKNLNHNKPLFGIKDLFEIYSHAQL